jgi:hypothetical protein
MAGTHPTQQEIVAYIRYRGNVNFQADGQFEFARKPAGPQVRLLDGGHTIPVYWAGGLYLSPQEMARQAGKEKVPEPAKQMQAEAYLYQQVELVIATANQWLPADQKVPAELLLHPECMHIFSPNYPEVGNKIPGTERLWTKEEVAKAVNGIGVIRQAMIVRARAVQDEIRAAGIEIPNPFAQVVQNPPVNLAAKKVSPAQRAAGRPPKPRVFLALGHNAANEEAYFRGQIPPVSAVAASQGQGCEAGGPRPAGFEHGHKDGTQAEPCRAANDLIQFALIEAYQYPKGNDTHPRLDPLRDLFAAARHEAIISPYDEVKYVDEILKHGYIQPEKLFSFNGHDAPQGVSEPLAIRFLERIAEKLNEHPELLPFFVQRSKRPGMEGAEVVCAFACALNYGNGNTWPPPGLSPDAIAASEKLAKAVLAAQAINQANHLIEKSDPNGPPQIVNLTPFGAGVFHNKPEWYKEYVKVYYTKIKDCNVVINLGLNKGLFDPCAPYMIQGLLEAGMPSDELAAFLAPSPPQRLYGSDGRPCQLTMTLDQAVNEHLTKLNNELKKAQRNLAWSQTLSVDYKQGDWTRDKLVAHYTTQVANLQTHLTQQQTVWRPVITLARQKAAEHAPVAAPAPVAEHPVPHGSAPMQTKGKSHPEMFDCQPGRPAPPGPQSIPENLLVAQADVHDRMTPQERAEAARQRSEAQKRLGPSAPGAIDQRLLAHPREAAVLPKQDARSVPAPAARPVRAASRPIAAQPPVAAPRFAQAQPPVAAPYQAPVQPPVAAPYFAQRPPVARDLPSAGFPPDSRPMSEFSKSIRFAKSIERDTRQLEQFCAIINQNIAQEYGTTVDQIPRPITPELLLAYVNLSMTPARGGGRTPMLEGGGEGRMFQRAMSSN